MNEKVDRAINLTKKFLEKSAKLAVKTAGKKLGLHVYDFPQAASCGAVILYTKNGNTLRLLTTKRAEAMGGGRSLSAGGFYEVKEMFNAPVGQVRDGKKDVYREMYEELGEEIKALIPYSAFEKRGEFISEGLVNKGNGFVNRPAWYALKITEKQMEKVIALSQTNEQVGKVIEEFEITKSPKDGYIQDRLSDFLNPEEIYAAQKWYTKMNQKHKGNYPA